jgi:predicted ATP-binding protein involved in virulence
MQYPLIKKIGLRNYKNLTINDVLELHNLNIFIGPNCCGKSNLIALFNFLKECVTTGIDIELTGLEIALDRLGGAKILDGKMARPNRVHFEFQFSQTKEINGSILELELDIPSDGRRVAVFQELLRSVTSDSPTVQPFY